MKIKHVVPFAYILAFYACGGTQPPVTNNGIAGGDSTLLTSTFTKVYMGLLGADTVLMKLDAKDKVINGAYFVKGKTDQVILNGTLYAKDSVRLEGLDAANQKALVFNGTIKSNIFSGQYYFDYGNKRIVAPGPTDYFSFNLTETTNPFNAEQYAVVDTLQYTIVKNSKKNKTIKCNCKAEYPQITNTVKKPAFDKINADIKKNFADVMDDCDGYEPYDGQSGDYENESLGSVILNNGIVFGVELAGYMTGGAHPSSWSITYYYDIETGGQIKLVDLFQGANLKKLATLAAEKLKKTHKVKKLVDAGFFENTITLKGSENFYLGLTNDSTFTLHFNSYDIGPYVMGPVDVDFAFSEVKPILSTRTAFSKVIK